jgi:hypothetical protein
MSTAAPSKSTGGGAGHSRGDQTSRFIRFIFIYNLSMFFFQRFRTNENRKARLATLWPEWNETDVNAESWDIGIAKKKDTGASKARTEAKSASSIVRK